VVATSAAITADLDKGKGGPLSLPGHALPAPELRSLTYGVRLDRLSDRYE